MTIFARDIPAGINWVCPQGSYRVSTEAFGWVNASLPALEQPKYFIQAAKDLFRWLQEYLVDRHFRPSSVQLVGFSQGAAMVHYLTLLQPEFFRTASYLSGFVPSEALTEISKQVFCNRPVFIAHGSKDEIIPIGAAKELRDLLLANEANVTYCESNNEHKLFLKCLKQLHLFIKENV